jgi:hypothetical protein
MGKDVVRTDAPETQRAVESSGRVRHFIAWTVLVLCLLAVVPLLYYAAYRGWLAGGPPTTPERRQVNLIWYFTCLGAAVAMPIVGILVFRRLRRVRRPHD